MRSLDTCSGWRKACVALMVVTLPGFATAAGDDAAAAPEPAGAPAGGAPAAKGGGEADVAQGKIVDVKAGSFVVRSDRDRTFEGEDLKVVVPGAPAPVAITEDFVGAVVRVEYLCKPDCDQGGEPTSIVLVPAQGLWRNHLTFGVQLSEDRGSFSEQDAILRFESDTLWHDSDRWRFHTFFHVGLVAVGNEEADADGTNQTSELESFLSSRKALTLQAGAYLPWEFVRGDDVLDLGWIVKGGVESITDFDDDAEDLDGTAVPGTEDTANFHVAAGLHFAHHQRTSKGVNPELLRSVDLTYGYYETYLSEDELERLAELEGLDPDDLDLESHRGRLVVDGRVRLGGRAPVYVGAFANLGRGPDDFRLYLALDLDLKKLAALVPGS